jgi:hypothetical protein
MVFHAATPGTRLPRTVCGQLEIIVTDMQVSRGSKPTRRSTARTLSSGFATCGYAPVMGAGLHKLVLRLPAVSRLYSQSDGTETEQNGLMLSRAV